MSPYKFGGILVLIYFVIAIIMFATLKEMAVLLAFNFLIIGAILLALYFVLISVYKRFGRKIFYITFVTLLIMPLGYGAKNIFEDFSSKARHEKRMNTPVTGEISINGKEAIVKHYSDNEVDFEKYKIISPKSGYVHVVSEPFIDKELLFIDVYNPKPNSVFSERTFEGNGVVYRVEKGEICYLIVDQTELNRTGKGTYELIIQIAENSEF